MHRFSIDCLYESACMHHCTTAPLHMLSHMLSLALHLCVKNQRPGQTKTSVQVRHAHLHTVLGVQEGVHAWLPMTRLTYRGMLAGSVTCELLMVQSSRSAENRHTLAAGLPGCRGTLVWIWILIGSVFVGCGDV